MQINLVSSAYLLPSPSGIGNLILRTLQTHPTPHLTHFYSSSGGNAGLAAVTAAVSLGRPATVIVPLTTPAFMIAKILTAGATQVLQRGVSWQEADTYLRDELLTKDPVNGVYVPPFDHPEIWAGNSTMIDEIEDQLPGGGRPDAVIGSVGGGGLFCGIMHGLVKKNWADTVSVLAMETQGAESLAKSLEKGSLITLPTITSIAKSLGATRVASEAFCLARDFPRVKSIVLTDAEAAMGCWRLADDERLLVEPACGVSVATCYDGRLNSSLVPGLNKDSKVVVVICGGSNVSLEMLVEWKARYGDVQVEMERASIEEVVLPPTPSRLCVLPEVEESEKMWSDTVVCV